MTSSDAENIAAKQSFFNNWCTATEQHFNAPWSGVRPSAEYTNFRCKLCGKRIQVGEVFMALYTNDMLGCGGNPLVCNLHTNYSLEQLRQRWREICEEAKQRFWWLWD